MKTGRGNRGVKMVEPNGSDIIVECIDLKKSYVLGEVKVDALRGINMRIKRGEMVAIQGPSGCGRQPY